MELGDYHLNEDFITDEQMDEYQEAVDEVVSIRNKIEKIISWPLTNWIIFDII